MSSLGERIRSRRNELGLTQSQLGGTELTKGFISLIEKGRAKPSIDNLKLLARRLKMPVGYFLEDSGPLGETALQVSMQAAWVALKQDDPAEASEGFSAALALAKREHDLHGEAECQIGLASALTRLEEHDRAAEHLRRGQEIAETTQMVEQLARASCLLGQIEMAQGDLRSAREHLMEGYHRLHEHGCPDLSLMADLLLTLGRATQDAGDPAEAERWYQEAATTLAPAEDLRRLSAAHIQWGAEARARNAHEVALGHLARAEHALEALAGPRLLAEARHRAATAALETGKADEAISHLQSALLIVERIGDDTARARTLVSLAEAQVHKGAYPLAEQALAEAERLTTVTPDSTQSARIELARARFLRRSGSPTEALSHYRHAITSFESLGRRTDLARACNELGELLIEQERPSEAAPYLARALQELNPHRTAPRATGDV